MVEHTPFWSYSFTLLISTEMSHVHVQNVRVSVHAISPTKHQILTLVTNLYPPERSGAFLLLISDLTFSFYPILCRTPGGDGPPMGQPVFAMPPPSQGSTNPFAAGGATESTSLNTGSQPSYTPGKAFISTSFLLLMAFDLLVRADFYYCDCDYNYYSCRGVMG